MSHRPLALLVALAALVAPGAAYAAPYQHHPDAIATGTGGAAATVDSVATQAAIGALRRGGNAVDAAVTAAGVLGVVEPLSCGIGGGGFMPTRTPDGRIPSLDGRETAPASMTPQSFLNDDGTSLAFNDARWS